MSNRLTKIGDDSEFQAMHAEFREALKELNPQASEDLFWNLVLCFLEDLWSEQ